MVISEQLNQNKSDAKFNEGKIQMSKSGIPKPSQKQANTHTSKPLQSSRQPLGISEQERHKKSKLDDYDKDLKHRRIEKASMEGKYFRIIFLFSLSEWLIMFPSSTLIECIQKIVVEKFFKSVKLHNCVKIKVNSSRISSP